MKITYTPAKNEANITERGLSFDAVSDCDWGEALIAEDTRHDYGERRYNALVPLHGRLHNVVFTPRDNAMHIISFRKANERERKKYDEAIR